MRTRSREQGVVLGVVLASVLAGGGVLAYVWSPAHSRHDPAHGLQQLALLYLDEPAPFADLLGIPHGRPTLLVVCEGCAAPAEEDLDVDADVEVIATDQPAVAAAYGLATDDGEVGPGYAIVDSRRAVRYRTFDPGLGEHGDEIAILLEAVP